MYPPDCGIGIRPLCRITEAYDSYIVEIRKAVTWSQLLYARGTQYTPDIHTAGTSGIDIDRCPSNAGWILGQRLGRWAGIHPALHLDQSIILKTPGIPPPPPRRVLREMSPRVHRAAHAIPRSMGSGSATANLRAARMLTHELLKTFGALQVRVCFCIIPANI